MRRRLERPGAEVRLQRLQRAFGYKRRRKWSEGILIFVAIATIVLAISRSSILAPYVHDVRAPDASGFRSRVTEDALPSERSSFTFKTCQDARDASVAPMMRGDAAYSWHLDKDGDGIACEPYLSR